MTALLVIAIVLTLIMLLGLIAVAAMTIVEFRKTLSYTKDDDCKVGRPWSP